MYWPLTPMYYCNTLVLLYQASSYCLPPCYRSGSIDWQAQSLRCAYVHRHAWLAAHQSDAHTACKNSHFVTQKRSLQALRQQMPYYAAIRCTLYSGVHTVHTCDKLDTRDVRIDLRQMWMTHIGTFYGNCWIYIGANISNHVRSLMISFSAQQYDGLLVLKESKIFALLWQFYTCFRLPYI